MILDALANAERTFALNPGFRKAFAYLQRTDLAALKPGRHEIDGDQLFLMLNQGSGRGRDGVKFEAHKKYIDIQYTLTGPDEIGWSPLASCQTIDTPYDDAKDFWLFADKPTLWFPVPPGTFAIFFPEDVHAPMAAPVGTPLVKAVFKVAVDWR